MTEKKTSSITPPEVLKTELVDRLLRLYSDWSDEIPDDVHFEGKFKVRINWWNMVCGNLQVIKKRGYLEFSPLLVRIDVFLAKYAGRDYWLHGQKRTTKEDIDEANKLLSDVINELQKK